MWPPQAHITNYVSNAKLCIVFVHTNLEGFIENWINCLLLDACFELGFFAGIRE